MFALLEPYGRLPGFLCGRLPSDSFEFGEHPPFLGEKKLFQRRRLRLGAFVFATSAVIGEPLFLLFGPMDAPNGFEIFAEEFPDFGGIDFVGPLPRCLRPESRIEIGGNGRHGRPGFGGGELS